MAIDSKHPAYTAMEPDWITMVDTHAGERAIKDKGQAYLPATSGMVADGMGLNQAGFLAYVNYKLRARFPDAVNTAVDALVGIMHSKPPTIELPTVMEPLVERGATNLGESLEVLLRRINQTQLTTGRLGLLLDVQDGAQVGTLPYIATYEAAEVLNWDDGSFNDNLVISNLNLVVLDESGVRRDSNFEWAHAKKFRVLVLGDPTENEPEGVGVYRVGVFSDSINTFNEATLIEPSLGGRTLDFIPFTFINASDVVATPDKPPLLGLAALSLGIYRGEADYRQALFMQGQDTLVVSGTSDPDANFRTGAGATIILPTSGTAEFIGVDSTGLSEMRSALENDKSEASQHSGALIDSTSRAKESGDALRIRVSARTATLNQVAKTGAFGLQQCLRQMAFWMGANPEDVIVTPNLDFVNDTLGGEELVKLITAKSIGAPISNASIHELMEEKGLTKLTLEEELALIEEEEPLGIGSSSDDLPEEDEGEGEGEDDGDN